ncbi:hypothetical protein [Streptomyces lunaelactis]|uniref:hypothetical protein n=1 Tax=Streptomyces lunaelactis TaxID=1535768 RepID=UPI001C3052E5
MLTHARVGTVVRDTVARADLAAQVPGVDTVIVFDPEYPSRHRAWETLRTAPTRNDRERLRAIAESVQLDENGRGRATCSPGERSTAPARLCSPARWTSGT